MILEKKLPTVCFIVSSCLFYRLGATTADAANANPDREDREDREGRREGGGGRHLPHLSFRSAPRSVSGRVLVFQQRAIATK